MQDPAPFEAYVRATLARHGVEADELDLQVIAAAEHFYGPLRDALLAADLSAVAPEAVLDPSGPPPPPEQPDAA